MNDRQKQLGKATEIANRHDDLHPWEVAVLACNRDRRADFEAFLVGLLHDSIEDGYATEEELSIFSTDVVDAVLTLTRQDGEKYWDYIKRVKGAPTLARKVKLSDAEVNLSRCRRSFGYASLENRYLRVIEELS
jgi:hypothetical protein